MRPYSPLVAVGLAFLLPTSGYCQAPTYPAPNSSSAASVETPSNTDTPTQAPAQSDPAPEPDSATTTPATPVNSEVHTQPSPTFHYDDLHPAFTLSPDDIAKAIQKGQDYAKRGKTFGDLAKDNIQQPRGIKGEKGKSHEALVVCYSLNGLDLEGSVFKATNNYEPVSVPDEFKTRGAHVHVLAFRVILESVPKVAVNRFDRDRTANEADVQVTRFVLTDDLGHVLNPKNTGTIEGVKQGTMNFSGVNTINHTNTSQTKENANASAYDNNGNSVTATGTSRQTTTYNWTEYQPWSESHPYYTATYDISFSLFDENGKALITKDAKSITLHMITPNGEKIVTYDLHPPKF